MKVQEESEKVGLTQGQCVCTTQLHEARFRLKSVNVAPCSYTGHNTQPWTQILRLHSSNKGELINKVRKMRLLDKWN